MRFSQYHHIDPPVLLRAAGDDLDAFRSLSETFLQIAPPMFARLQQALNGTDRKALVQASHALRGTVALVGAHALAALLLAIERPTEAGPEAATPAAAELSQLMQAVLLEVQASIADSHSNFSIDDKLAAQG